MSTDKYVPSDEAVRGSFAGVLDEYCGIPLEEGVAAFDRWLAAHDARIRRDGAREALDGLAETYPFGADVFLLADYRDQNYPHEETRNGQ